MTAAPVSLYLQLEEGKTADMEVVARAALAFSAAVKSAVFELDPNAEVRVELVSGTEGSLSLNSVIRTFNEQRKPIAVVAALTVLSWFGQHYFEDFMDALHGHSELSEEEKKSIARAVADELARRSEAPTPAIEVYRELAKDPVVQGVGASLSPTKPRAIVPRSEFPVGDEDDPHILLPPEDGKQRRSRPRRMTVVLISPVLVRGARRWKLKSFEGEFGATMSDRQFQEDVLSGRRQLPSVEGVLLDVDLETIDEFNGVVWKSIANRVLRVHDVILPATQTELDL